MRHRDSCECDACWNRKHPYEAELKRQQDEEEYRIRNAEYEKRKKCVANILGVTLDTQHSIILYDIFMDDEKCAAIISKLKNKAFW